MKLKNKNYPGFTLLELAVVIAIVGIMTSVALVSLNPAREAEKLKTSQREVASAIKMTQSYALQGKTQGSPPKTPEKYGVKFTNNTDYQIYYIFKDLTSGTAESLKLPEGVVLNETTPYAVIEFTVPHADITTADLPKDIKFKAPGGTTDKITIEKGGAIKEE